MLIRAKPRPSVPKAGPGLRATRPRSRNAAAGSSPRPGYARRSSQTTKPASGRRHRARGRCSASRRSSRSRFASSAAHISSSQPRPSVSAVSAAIPPRWPIAPASARGIGKRSGSPLTTNAHLSPARLNALDAEESARPTAGAVGETARNDVKSRPPSVSGAQISSETTTAPCRAAISASSASSAVECGCPVGLWGWESRIARAPAANSRSMPARSRRGSAPSWSSSGTATGVWSTRRIHGANGM